MMLPSTASTSAGQLLQRRVFDLAALEAVAGAGANPVQDFAAPALPPRSTQTGPARCRRPVRYGPSGRFAAAAWMMESDSAHLVDPHLHAVQHVAILDRPERARKRADRLRTDDRAARHGRRRKRARPCRRCPARPLFPASGCRCAPAGRASSRTISISVTRSRNSARPVASVSSRAPICSALPVRRTPPMQAMPRSSRLPVSTSLMPAAILRGRVRRE